MVGAVGETIVHVACSRLGFWPPCRFHAPSAWDRGREAEARPPRNPAPWAWATEWAATATAPRASARGPPSRTGHYASAMELNVLRVFLGPDGGGGNLLGVFLDGTAIEPERRQAVALELGFSETVFVDEVHDASAHIAIFTPGRELPFAGHPTVGTSWFLAERGQPVDVLHCKAGDVATWQADGATWVRARAEWAPRFAFQELASAEAVDTFDPPKLGEPGVYVWAWEDEAAGRIRARCSRRTMGSPRTRPRAPRPSSWDHASGARSSSARVSGRRSSSSPARTAWSRSAAARRSSSGASSPDAPTFMG